MSRASRAVAEWVDPHMMEAIMRLSEHQAKTDAMMAELLSREGKFRKAGPCRYTLHNLVGHPLMELLHLCGLPGAALWAHQITLPKSERDDDVAQAVRAGEYFRRPQ